MRLHFDEKADALYMRLDDSTIIDSLEVQPGIVLDFMNRTKLSVLRYCGLKNVFQTQIRENSSSKWLEGGEAGSGEAGKRDKTVGESESQ